MREKKKRMRIRKKLLISYFSIVALIVVVGVLGIYNIHSVYENGNEIYINNLKSVEYLKSINQNVKEIDQCIISMMTALDSSNHVKYMTTITALKQKNEELMKAYETISISDMERKRYQQCRLSILSFNKQIEEMLGSMKEGEKGAALQRYEQELMPVKACTYELIDAVVEMATSIAEQKNKDNMRIYQRLIWMICLVGGIAVVAAIIITVYMNNYFTSKLIAIQHLAKRISEYNVSDDILGTENDEFGETMEALNDSQFKMRELLEKIISESADISDTGVEVSAAVRKSNQRIEAVNVKLYDAESILVNVYDHLDELMENRELSQEIVAAIQEMMDYEQTAKEEIKDIQSELSSIAMFLEQIGITSDYQNEIATGHKQQVEKFKV
ncbi:MAG: methyl-accepting chemotaxis protein [Lachnospira sp.]|nr:methyl-accepting chemotaxis protein [Lachnospira sp.]